jgi:transposase
MRSYVKTGARDDNLVVPWDLTEWVDQASLRQWITEEVETLDWNNPEVVAILRTYRTYQPQMMLCLLTYAYATAVFESDEIVRRCYSEESFRLISGGHGPETANVVSRFRRENRGLLKWCLAQVFKRAIRANAGEVLLPAGLKPHLLDAAVMRLNVARHLDRGAEGL